MRESRRAELYFCSPGKTVWTDASQLVSSGRSRIVGYYNRPKTCATWTWPTLYPLGFPEPHYILPCTACVVTHRTNLGFANLVPCAATVVYSIPSADVHRRLEEQVSEPVALVILYGRGRIRFLGSAPRDCFQVLHHGSTSWTISGSAGDSSPTSSSSSCYCRRSSCCRRCSNDYFIYNCSVRSSRSDDCVRRCLAAVHVN